MPLHLQMYELRVITKERPHVGNCETLYLIVIYRPVTKQNIS